MTVSIYKTDKSKILKKLKEIGMDVQEDRISPEKEACEVASKEEKFDGTDTEYFKSIYDEKGLAHREQHGSMPQPTKDQPAVENVKS